jgi:hypothetical protein
MKGTLLGLKGLVILISLFCLLFLLHTSHADPLDNWHWRNPLPQGNSLNGVTYGNGRFVAVGNAGTILTSPDGVTWTQRDSGVAQNLNGVAYGNGLFVAVGETILISPDSVTWTAPNPQTHYFLSAVAYGNGNFVAVGYGTVPLVSTDGAAWSEAAILGQLDYFVYLSGVAYGNGLFVAVGNA